MEYVKEQLTEWIKEMLIGFIVKSYEGTFTGINEEIGNIATQVGMDPASFSPDIFQTVRNLSETVIMPIAGMILTFIACYELIQMIIDHNNMANFEIWMLFKWIFKTSIAILLISNTFDIVLGVFDVAQYVVSQSGSLIQSDLAISSTDVASFEASLMDKTIGEILTITINIGISGICIRILKIAIFVIIYGRMVEIYLLSSMAPIPFATFGNREQSSIGQNYLRSLIAIGFQGFLIMVCVAIYAAVINRVPVSDDVVKNMWEIIGCTTLLCFTLLKTGGLAKSVLNSH